MIAQQLTAKIFIEEAPGLALEDFIPVFHRWIREAAVPGHLLIDVADYTHVKDGPGVLLIAHDAHIAVELVRGRFGLRYSRKRDQPGPIADKLRDSLEGLVGVARLMEQEELQIRFSACELEVGILSRRFATANDASGARLEAALASYLRDVVGDAPLKVRSASNGRGPLTAHARVDTRPGVGSGDLVWGFGAEPGGPPAGLRVVR